MKQNWRFSILASADLLKGRTLTSYPPLQDDMVNAGGTFRDEEVVVDNNLITSRTPKDEPAFIRENCKLLIPGYLRKQICINQQNLKK
jgi:protease I